MTSGVPLAVGVGPAAIGGGLPFDGLLPGEPLIATTIPTAAPVPRATAARIAATGRLKGVFADASGGGGTAT
ncbi:MAG: hypothetical protein WEF51_00580 [Chloroflexota bacterium]